MGEGLSKEVYFLEISFLQIATQAVLLAIVMRPLQVAHRKARFKVRLGLEALQVAIPMEPFQIVMQNQMSLHQTRIQGDLPDINTML